jgi:hypothetical protein
METTAGKEYQKCNPLVTVNQCGFFIHKSLPFLGASPDAILQTEAGVGCLEVKCSYTHQHQSIKEAISHWEIFIFS